MTAGAVRAGRRGGGVAAAGRQRQRAAAEDEPASERRCDGVMSTLPEHRYRPCVAELLAAAGGAVATGRRCVRSCVCGRAAGRSARRWRRPPPSGSVGQQREADARDLQIARRRGAVDLRLRQQQARVRELELRRQALADSAARRSRRRAPPAGWCRRSPPIGARRATSVGAGAGVGRGRRAPGPAQAAPASSTPARAMALVGLDAAAVEDRQRHADAERPVLAPVRRSRAPRPDSRRARSRSWNAMAGFRCATRDGHRLLGDLHARCRPGRPPVRSRGAASRFGLRQRRRQSAPAAPARWSSRSAASCERLVERQVEQLLQPQIGDVAAFARAHDGRLQRVARDLGAQQLELGDAGPRRAGRCVTARATRRPGRSVSSAIDDQPVGERGIVERLGDVECDLRLRRVEVQAGAVAASRGLRFLRLDAAAGYRGPGRTTRRGDRRWPGRTAGSRNRRRRPDRCPGRSVSKRPSNSDFSVRSYEAAPNQLRHPLAARQRLAPAGPATRRLRQSAIRSLRTSASPSASSSVSTRAPVGAACGAAGGGAAAGDGAWAATADDAASAAARDVATKWTDRRWPRW